MRETIHLIIMICSFDPLAVARWRGEGWGVGGRVVACGGETKELLTKGLCGRRPRFLNHLQSGPSKGFYSSD